MVIGFPHAMRRHASIILFTWVLLLGVAAARGADRFQLRVNEILRPTGGAALVSDPRTGEILAVWNPRIVFHRAYPPGSAAKLVTSAIALENDLITPSERLNCRRVPMLLGQPYHCSHPAALESFTISSALANSCNYFFVALSTRIDAAVLARGYAMFGFGASSNVDRPPLRISSEPAAKARAALGDRPVLVTPAELLLAYSAVAMHGPMYELKEGKSKPATLARTVHLKPSTWGTLVDGLEGCVSVGTCQAAAVPGVRVAGKTGTAGLSDGSGLTHAWFAGYAPAHAPEVAIVVFLPRGTGTRDAAPLAGELLRTFFELRGKP
jgi:cell division protein FtsI/penicillin-binding protein 2